MVGMTWSRRKGTGYPPPLFDAMTVPLADALRADIEPYTGGYLECTEKSRRRIAGLTKVRNVAWGVQNSNPF